MTVTVGKVQRFEAASWPPSESKVAASGRREAPKSSQTELPELAGGLGDELSLGTYTIVDDDDDDDDL